MRLRGTVESFDAVRGDGTILAEDGSRYYFHCVEIADGSRHVEVGAVVSARRVPGRRGVDEAAEVRSLP